jgi:hypothetical protein
VISFAVVVIIYITEPAHIRTLEDFFFKKLTEAAKHYNIVLGR